MATTSSHPTGAASPTARRRVTALVAAMLLPLSVALPAAALASTSTPQYGADYQSQVPAAARTAPSGTSSTPSTPSYGADYQSQVPATARGVRPAPQDVELLGSDPAENATGQQATRSCDTVPVTNPREHLAHRDARPTPR